jgi:hypothetical protein
MAEMDNPTQHYANTIQLQNHGAKERLSHPFCECLAYSDLSPHVAAVIAG